MSRNVTEPETKITNKNVHQLVGFGETLLHKLPNAVIMGAFLLANNDKKSKSGFVSLKPESPPMTSKLHHYCLA